MKRLCLGILIAIAVGVLGVQPSASRAADVLFVGGALDDPTAGDDLFVFDHLQDVLGHNVLYLAGEDSLPADGEAADLIVISSTLGSGTVRGKFHDVATPVLNWEEAVMDGTTGGGDFAMAAGSQNGQGLEGTEIEIINSAHPLAAGLSGVVEFADFDIRLPHVTPPLGPGVFPIATLPAQGGDIELSPSGTGVHLGSTQNGGNTFTGFLDEMAIWDRSLSFEVDANQNLTGGEAHTVFTQGVAPLVNGNSTPIGYWSFDGDGDPIDESGNGHDGFLEGGAFPSSATSAPNVGGSGSLEVDGTGFVDVPTIERPGGELAYSFWFNADSSLYGDTVDTGDPRIDFFYGNGDGGTVRPHLSMNRNGRPVGLYVNSDGDLPTPFEAETDAFDTDEWHHVLITWDGDVSSIFVDGQLDNQVSLSESTLFAITAVDQGAELQDGTMAAGKRVNFPIENTGFASLTDDGLSLFDAAIEWLLGASSVPGDFNGNGSLDVEDIDQLTAASASGDNNVAFDLTGDGSVNVDDVDFWARDLRQTWIGDANVDGEFNSGDFVQVFQAGKFETGEAAVWSNGDWNGDGLFDSGDFVRAFQDGGFENGPRAATMAVPEPTSLVLIMSAVGLLLGMRRRR